MATMMLRCYCGCGCLLVYGLHGVGRLMFGWELFGLFCLGFFDRVVWGIN